MRSCLKTLFQLASISSPKTLPIIADHYPHYRQQSSELIFRGRKLVLNYTGGSPCETKRTKVPRRIVDDGDDKKDDDSKKGDNKKGDDKKGDDKKGDDRKDDDKDHDGEDKIVRRKSTIISFLCERDSLAPKAHLSFVGASEDECTYFFEAKAMAACGGVSQVQQPLGPGGVFGVMYVFRTSSGHVTIFGKLTVHIEH